MRLTTVFAASTAGLILLAGGFSVGAWVSIRHGIHVQRTQQARIASYRRCNAGRTRDCWLAVDAIVVQRHLDQTDIGSSSYWMTLAGGGESATEDVGEKFWPLLPLHRHVQALFLNKQLALITFPHHEPYYADHFPSADGSIVWYGLGLACVLLAAACAWCGGQVLLDWHDDRYGYSV